MRENEIFILEGIHALNDRLMASIGSTANIGVYISLYDGYNTDGKMLFSSRDIRFVRRLVRDYNYRSIDIDTTMKQWSNVIEGEELYIMPYIKNAKYDLENYTLYLGDNRTVSNEFLEDDIEVEFTKGKILVIFSKD